MKVGRQQGELAQISRYSLAELLDAAMVTGTHGGTGSRPLGMTHSSQVQGQPSGQSGDQFQSQGFQRNGDAYY